MADTSSETPISVCFFYIPEKTCCGRLPPEVLFGWRRWLQRLRMHNNITLLHENEKGIYGDNASAASDLMQVFAGKHFSCTFDFANFIQCGQDPSEAYEMLSPYISYVHVKDALFAAMKSSGGAERRTSAGNFPKARRFRLSRLFKPRAAFSQFQRSCSIEHNAAIRTGNNTEKRRSLGGIEGAGIKLAQTDKSKQLCSDKTAIRSDCCSRMVVCLSYRKLRFCHDKTMSAGFFLGNQPCFPAFKFCLPSSAAKPHSILLPSCGNGTLCPSINTVCASKSARRTTSENQQPFGVRITSKS